MADRFLREISDLHQMRKEIRSLRDAAREDFMKRLGDDAADHWVFRTRGAQLPPSDLGWCCLFSWYAWHRQVPFDVGGGSRRGASRKRIHLIAPADFQDVNLEGRSGMLATCGRDPRPRWVSSKRRLEWPNGAFSPLQ